MIIKEFYLTQPDGTKLYRTYSDKSLMIRQVETGIEYDEAVDVETSNYTYVETDKPCAGDDITDEEAFDIIMGRNMHEPTDGT